MFVFAGLPRALPAGYGAAALTEAEQAAAVRLCVVVKAGGKAGEAGTLISLRETLDAKVYLACLIDSGGRVHQWAELWVQDLTGLGEALPGYRQALNNTVLDQRWALRSEG